MYLSSKGVEKLWRISGKKYEKKEMQTVKYYIVVIKEKSF